jgi:hypothetical protein
MIDDRMMAGGAHVAAPDPVMAPNAGAHRLLHWLTGDLARGVRGLAALAAHGVEDATVDRLIDGSLVPFEETADAIARATAGAVLPGDWDAPGAVWDVLPAERAA